MYHPSTVLIFYNMYGLILDQIFELFLMQAFKLLPTVVMWLACSHLSDSITCHVLSWCPQVLTWSKSRHCHPTHHHST